MSPVKFDRKKILLGSVIAVVAILGVFYFTSRPSRKEPVYQGKTLTKWLKQLDDGEASGISTGLRNLRTPSQIEAAEAIRSMSAEAFPLLMEDIHARPDRNHRRIKLWEWLNFHDYARFIPWSYRLSVTEEDRIRWRAAQGLAALGPLAKSAVPELKRLLLTNYFHSSIKEAAYVLATIGPEGIDILTNAVQPQTEWSGMCAIWALGQHPAAGTNAISFLLNATSSQSEGTACGAIQVLGLFHMEGERVIPVLTNALASTNSSVSSSAAWALGQFGPDAAPAVPLLQLLTNNAATRDNALEALENIQSSAADLKKK